MGRPYLPIENESVNKLPNGKSKTIKTPGTIRIESLKRNGRLEEKLSKTAKTGK